MKIPTLGGEDEVDHNTRWFASGTGPSDLCVFSFLFITTALTGGHGYNNINFRDSVITF
jgi:hypothetical protein